MSYSFTERRWWTTLDVASVALLVRLALVAYAPAEPVWDGHYYDVGARRIAAGLGYGEDLSLAAADGGGRLAWDPWAHYPVGYPGFLAFFFRLMGGSIAVPLVANAITGALLAAAAHRVALRVFGPRDDSPSTHREMRAAIAGFMVGLHPGLVLYSGALMSEPLAAFGVLAALYWSAGDRNPWRGAAGAGVVLGLTTLVRPNAILMAPFVALVGLAGHRTRAFVPIGAPSGAPSRAPSIASSATRDSASGVPPSSVPPSSQRESRPSFSSADLGVVVRKIGVGRSAAILLARVAIVSVLALATVAPWTWRNCRRMDACAFVSTNAGWNLVIGSAPGATGKFGFLVGHTPAGGPPCDEGGQVAQDRCWWRYGVSTIRHDFVRWLKLIPAKLHHTVDGEWFPINYLREARPDLVSAHAHVVCGKVLTAVHQSLVIAAALAAVGRPARRWNRLGPYSLQVGLFAALVALAVYGLDLPTPMVWPLAVAACVLPLIKLPNAPARNASEIGVAALVLTTLVTHAIFFGEDRYHLVATPALCILAAGLLRRSAPQVGVVPTVRTPVEEPVIIEVA